jgi:hypothetical protein
VGVGVNFTRLGLDEVTVAVFTAGVGGFTDGIAIGAGSTGDGATVLFRDLRTRYHINAIIMTTASNPKIPNKIYIARLGEGFSSFFGTVDATGAGAGAAGVGAGVETDGTAGGVVVVVVVADVAVVEVVPETGGELVCVAVDITIYNSIIQFFTYIHDLIHFMRTINHSNIKNPTAPTNTTIV